MSITSSAYDAVDGSSTRHVSAMDVGAVKAPTIRRSQVMQAITTIGLDIASWFSRFMASMRRAMSSSVVSLSGGMCWPSSRSCRRA